MARFYSNENIAIQVVRELRRLGHDVLTRSMRERRTLPSRMLKCSHLLSLKIVFCCRTIAGTSCTFISTRPATTLESSFARLTRTFVVRHSESTRPSKTPLR